MASILRDSPLPLQPGVPTGLARIIERCLAKDPAERPSRAGEVELALEVIEPAAEGPVKNNDGSATRSRVIAGLWISTAAAALAASLALWCWVRDSNGPRGLVQFADVGSGICRMRRRQSRGIPTRRQLGPCRHDRPMEFARGRRTDDPADLGHERRVVSDVVARRIDADFFAHRTGNREIWTMPAVGGEWRQVTDNPGPDLHPSWSHDGRTLAHLTQRHEGTGGWVSPLDGRPGHMVTESFTLAWSPIDSRLAYRQSDRMWIRDTNRDVPAQPLPTTANGPPRWTPDGRHLVYRSSGNSIAIVAADGATPQRLLADCSARRGGLGDHGTPTDGRFVYFTWNDDLGDIWVMEVVSSPR